MQSKITLQWPPCIGGALVVAFFAMTTFLPSDTVTGSSTSELLDSGLPIRLTISKITVDAAIEYVGLTTEGAMDVPKDPDNAAWFNLGTRPGEVGSAVIAGHSGWKDSTPAVFDDLPKLRVGDKVSVMDGKGVTVTFVVRKIRTYDSEEDASDVFGSNDGKAHLNLVTCEGTWDPVSKSSSKRLVVFSDKE